MARAKSLLVLALAALAVAGGHAQVVTIGADGVVSVGATAQPVNVNGLAGTPVDGFSEARPIVSVPDTACTPVLMVRVFAPPRALGSVARAAAPPALRPPPRAEGPPCHALPLLGDSAATVFATTVFFARPLAMRSA